MTSPKSFALAPVEIEKTPKHPTSFGAPSTTKHPTSFGTSDSSEPDLFAEDESFKHTDPSVISTKELNTIKEKYKLSNDEIEEVASYTDVFGGYLEGQDPKITSQLMGFFGDAVGLGLPQAAIIESQSDPRIRDALNDLRQLTESKKSGLRQAGEIGAGLLTPGLGVAKAGKLAKGAVMAGIPAVEMGAKADREERGEQALIGAALGTGLGVLGNVAAETLAKARKSKNKKVAEQLSNTINNLEDEGLDLKVEKILAEDKNVKARELELKVLLEPTKISKDEAIKLVGGKKKLAAQTLKLGSNNEAETLKNLVHSKRAHLANKLNKTHQGTKLGPIDSVIKKSHSKSAVELRAEADKVIEGMQRQGNLEQLYNEMKTRETMIKVISTDKVRSKEMNAASKIIAFISDNAPLAKIFDKKYGTEGELLLSKASEKHNNYTISMRSLLESSAEISNKTKKLDVDTTKVYDSLDGKKVDLNTEEKAAVDSWREFFSTSADSLDSLGIKVLKRDNYVPHMRLPIAEYKAQLKQDVNYINEKYGVDLFNLDGNQFKELKKKSGTFGELTKEIGNLTGHKIASSKAFSGEIHKMLNSRAHLKETLAMDAGVLKARETGNVPSRYLEKDIGKLSARWVTQTLRAEAFRGFLLKANTYAEAMDKIGDTHASKFWRNLALDIKGVRSNTFADMQSALSEELTTFAKIREMEATDPLRKKMYQTIGDAPALLSLVNSQVYNNYIGWNPKSIVQNFVSPALGVVPDFGPVYGSKKLGKAWGDIYDMRKNGIDITLTPEMAQALGKKPGEVYKTKSLAEFLHNEGFHPKHWTGEVVDAMDSGHRSTGTVAGARAATDKLNTYMMWGFEKSELAARAQSVFMGRGIAMDLIEKPELRKEILEKIDSPAYKRRIQEALNQGNTQEVIKLVPQFINANNMLNYNRINMSQYGRFMGPAFSVFSKWPTSIAGRILSDYERRGLKGGSERIAKTLVAPYLLLTGVDAMTKDSIEDNPAAKAVVGSAGLRNWTPFDSVVNLIAEGSVGAAPGFEATKAAYEGIGKSAGEMILGEGDIEKAQNHLYKGFRQATQSFAPGAGAVRVFKDELPSLLLNKDPKEIWD